MAADSQTIIIAVMGIILAISVLLIVIMYVRIQQLSNELGSIKNRVQMTDDELERLSKDIQEFKLLTI